MGVYGSDIFLALISREQKKNHTVNLSCRIDKNVYDTLLEAAHEKVISLN